MWYVMDVWFLVVLGLFFKGGCRIWMVVLFFDMFYLVIVWILSKGIVGNIYY